MGKPPLQLGAREVLATRVACHPKEEMVAIGYQDGMILAVRFADAEEAVMRRAGGGPVSALTWDDAGPPARLRHRAGRRGRRRGRLSPPG